MQKEKQDQVGTETRTKYPQQQGTHQDGKKNLNLELGIKVQNRGKKQEMAGYGVMGTH